MFFDQYLGSFNRQLEPRFNPATVRIPFLPGVFAALPYGQEPIAKPQPVRLIKGRQKVTRLGAYQYFREHL